MSWASTANLTASFTADWEGRKCRSADSNPNRNVPVTILPVSPKLETPDLKNGNFGDGVCGIKGFRPPLLATTAGGAGVVRSPSSSGEHDGRGVVGRLRNGERRQLGREMAKGSMQ